ncbi:MAG TPA: hypothetical protein VJR70_11590 [Stellaceae bacterium]|nr:hypothetical protein [Stellaceae bacterium]
MSDDRGHDDAEIIRAAYAERVRDAFRIFADNLGVGENEKLCRDRFERSLQMVRRARDLALLTASGHFVPDAPPSQAPAEQADASEGAADPLSAEDQALVEKILAGTRGTAVPHPPRR